MIDRRSEDKHGREEDKRHAENIARFSKIETAIGKIQLNLTAISESLRLHISDYQRSQKELKEELKQNTELTQMNLRIKQAWIFGGIAATRIRKIIVWVATVVGYSFFLYAVWLWSSGAGPMPFLK